MALTDEAIEKIQDQEPAVTMSVPVWPCAWWIAGELCARVLQAARAERGGDAAGLDLQYL